MSTSFTELLDEPSDDELTLRVMNIEDVDEGGRPVIELFGREEDGTFHHIEVTGHEPSVFIHEDEYNESVKNHYAVKRVEYGHESLQGEPLVRLYTYLPKQVSELSEVFDRTWESDIWYTQRFTLDNGIKTGCRIDLSNAEEGHYGAEHRVTQDDIVPCDPPSVSPRLCVVDIEVASDGGVPEYSDPYDPITTIVAYDSYTERYVGWLYCETFMQTPDDQESAADEAELDELRLFHDEAELLDDFSAFIEQVRPDILSGWYSNDFDYPYLIERCRELDVWKHKDWSPLGNTYVSTKWDDPVVDGVSMIDMLEAYQKTRIHKLPKKSLDYVAGIELGAEKIEIDTSHADMWREDTVEFLRYNKRDVELTYEIGESKSVFQLFQRMRDLTGCQFSDFQFNVVMIGMLVLHKAIEEGVRLPTAEKPDSDWFHGAVVLDSVAGLHENVVYLDYSSLYPTMMLLCNMSNETLIGDSEALEASPYTEEDCYKSFHDPRLENVKEGQEPVEEPVYFAKEDTGMGVVDGQGLMASVVNDMIDLKMDYKGMGTYYVAVKQVTNSIWGVQGDKDSFGRGWRLFNWMMAEAITLGGRRALMFGSETALDWLHDNGYEDAEIVIGDTDGFGISIPSADGREEAVTAAEAAAAHVDDRLVELEESAFNASKELHELEVESYAERLFVQAREGETSGGEGTKKKYAEKVTWKDGEPLDEPELKIKGFGYVRSDRADVSKQAQKKVFEALMENEPSDAKRVVFDWLDETIAAICNTERDDEIGIPFGIQKPLASYGSSEKTPQPQYRGARYANQEIYGGSAITRGTKPMYYYIKEGVTGDCRATYKSPTKENGRYVDAISVFEASDLPEGVGIDYEKMIEKTLRGQLKRIFSTLQWEYEWDRVIERSLPSEYFRDDEQLGLSPSDFM